MGILSLMILVHKLCLRVCIDPYSCLSVLKSLSLGYEFFGRNWSLPLFVHGQLIKVQMV